MWSFCEPSSTSFVSVYPSLLSGFCFLLAGGVCVTTVVSVEPRVVVLAVDVDDPALLWMG